jgi:hypothetical protein
MLLNTLPKLKYPEGGKTGCRGDGDWQTCWLPHF